MDGILLHADGYHRALQDSVRLIGRNLGIEKPDLTREHIAKLEAGGVTHEWESLAICSAILLTQIWRVDPDARIPHKIDVGPEKFLMHGEDFFTNFLQNLDLGGEFPTTYAERLLLEKSPSLLPEQKEYLRFVLRNGQNFKDSPTLLVFQEYVLGSESFSSYFSRPSQLNTKSYLELYDRASLSPLNQDKLLKWLESKTHHAVIFTNRPSKPPDGFFSTPEAELGASAIGLNDLPIVGAGSLSWLANQESRPLHIYYKPNPVHALAALRVAVGESLVSALRAALNFYHGDFDRGSWLPFDGARVIVFEDLTPGLVSAISAEQLLQDAGIGTSMTLVGVSSHSTKAEALSHLADYVTEDINSVILPEIIS
jgi:hypothetical protein